MTLLPQITIFIIALIGLFVHGIVGFLAWGAIGYVSIFFLSRTMQAYSGGLLPRNMRKQTVIDFIDAHPEECQRTFPEKSAEEKNQAVTGLLEAFAVKAVRVNPSRDLSQALSSAIFIPAAEEVINSKQSAEEKSLARSLINFLKNHPLWYG